MAGSSRDPKDDSLEGWRDQWDGSPEAPVLISSPAAGPAGWCEDPEDVTFHGAAQTAWGPHCSDSETQYKCDLCGGFYAIWNALAAMEACEPGKCVFRIHEVPAMTAAVNELENSDFHSIGKDAFLGGILTGFLVFANSRCFLKPGICGMASETWVSPVQSLIPWTGEPANETQVSPASSLVQWSGQRNPGLAGLLVGFRLWLQRPGQLDFVLFVTAWSLVQWTSGPA